MSPRVVEHVKSALILALLLLSFWLSSRIWLPPALSAAREGYRMPFVAPQARDDLTWTEVVKPRSVVVHLGHGRVGLVDPASDLADFLWRAVAQAAAGVPAARLELVDVAVVERLRAGREGVVGVEAFLPGSVRLAHWLELWAGLAGTEVAPSEILGEPVDRVMVFAGADRGWVLFRTVGGHLGAPVPLTDAGPAAGAAAAVDSLDQLIHFAASASQVFLPAEELGAVEGLTVAPGVFVPAGQPAPSLLQLGPQELAWDQLARSFFADPSTPRKVVARGVILYTDGLTSLSVRPAEGLVEYQAPLTPGAASSPPPGLVDALELAVDFGNQHGGWPDGVVLEGVTSIVARGSLDEPRVLGYRFTFARRIAGLHLARSPVAVVEVGPAGVTTWRRRFEENRLQDQLGFPVQRPADAVARAAALPRSELPQPSRVLKDVTLVYIGQGGGYQVPAWELAFHDGTLVWVGAWAGGPVWVSAPAR